MQFMTIKKSMCLLLASVITASTPAVAAETVNTTSTDVAISDGVLVGTVLNKEAKPVAGLNVQLLHETKVIASATSDEKGQFAIRGLRNGSHVLQVGTVQQPVRFWGTQAAPPSAVSKIAVVVDEKVVRGQTMGMGGGLAGNLVPFAIFGGALGATLAATIGADEPAPASP